jgi:hypothetical protein
MSAATTNSASLTIASQTGIKGSRVVLSSLVTPNLHNSSQLKFSLSQAENPTEPIAKFVAEGNPPNTAVAADGQSVSFAHSVDEALGQVFLHYLRSGDVTVTATVSHTSFLERVYQRRHEDSTGNSYAIAAIHAAGEYVLARSATVSADNLILTRQHNEQPLKDGFHWQTSAAVNTALKDKQQISTVGGITYDGEEDCFVMIGYSTDHTLGAGVVMKPDGSYVALAASWPFVTGVTDACSPVALVAAGDGILYGAGVASTYTHIWRCDGTNSAPVLYEVFDSGSTARTPLGLAVAHDQSHLAYAYVSSSDLLFPIHYTTTADGAAAAWTAASTVPTIGGSVTLNAGPLLLSTDEVTTSDEAKTNACLFAGILLSGAYTVRRYYDRSDTTFETVTFEEVDVAALVAPFGDSFKNGILSDSPDDDMVFVPSGAMVRGDMDAENGPELFVGGYFRWQRKLTEEEEDLSDADKFIEVPAVCRLRNVMDDIDSLIFDYFIPHDAFDADNQFRSRRMTRLAYNVHADHKTLWANTGTLSEYYFIPNVNFTSAAKLSAKREAGDLGISALSALLIGMASGLAIAGVIALIMWLIRRNA